MRRATMLAGGFLGCTLKNRPHLEKILFQQNNALLHTCVFSIDKIMKLKFELLQHLQYLPDLSSSDFFKIPNSEKWLGG